MNNTQIFKHPKFGALRVMMDEKGEPWFVGKVVAEMLGYANPSKEIAFHVEAEDTKVLTYKAYNEMGKASDFWNGNDYSNKTMINESGLYSLILGSRLPQARIFKHWVTADVLTSIRKNGGYIGATAEMSEEEIVAKAFEVVTATIESRRKRIEEETNSVNSLEKQVNVFFDEFSKMIKN